MRRLLKHLKLFSFFLALTVFPFKAHADCRIEPQAMLALNFDGFLPTVTVRINGHKVIMGIDTGAQATILTPQAVRALHLPPAPALKHIKMVRVETFDFAGVRRENLSLPVVSIPVHRLPNRNIAGLIGANLLAHYDIDYNPPLHRISLYETGTCSTIRPPWRGHYTAIPAIITRSHRMAIHVRLNGHALTAIIDTGSSGLRLASSSLHRVGLTRKDLVHDTANRMHRFKRLQIGNELFGEPHVQILRMPAKEADMLLGANYLHRRRLWLSYAAHVLFIQKGTH